MGKQLGEQYDCWQKKCNASVPTKIPLSFELCICRVVYFSSYKKNHALCCRIQVSNVRLLQHPSCWERHSAFYFNVVCYKNNASLSRTILWTKKLLTHEFLYLSFSCCQKGVNWSNDTVVQKTSFSQTKRKTTKNDKYNYRNTHPTVSSDLSW